MSGDTRGGLEFFAACPRHVPDLLAGELRALGLDVTREHPAGVSFTGPIATVTSPAWPRAPRAACCSRSAPCRSTRRKPCTRPSVRCPGRSTSPPRARSRSTSSGRGPAWLRHTQFAAQKAKDAIVDRIRERSGARPSVDLVAPDLRLNLSLMRERASLAIDLSGDPLHRRGYRQSGVEAPLKENLAAALLLRCGWPAIAAAGGAFVDPMCGSGTLVIEAALMAADVAPGLLRRRFGFERWLQHEAAVWEELRAAALERRRIGELGTGRFRGYDRDQTAIRASLANSGRSSVGDHLVFERRELAHLSRAAASHGLVLVNPPYGARLDEAGDARAHYGLLGAKLMECFPGWEAGVFTGNPPLGRALRLRAYRAHTFFNGPIECRLLRFELLPETVEPDAETARRARLEAARARPGASMFGNRLRKNFQRLETWAKRADVACFRVYDADMPEYAFAVDLYGNDERWACVQEYAAPATVAPEAARGRRDEVARRAARGAGAAGRARRAARAPPPARRRAVREGGRGGRVPHRPRGALPVPRELHRLPRHGAVPRSPPHAAARRRTGGRAVLPEPVRLHGHRDRARGGRRGDVLDHGGHVAHLPRLGEAQPRAERPRRSAARVRAGRLPRVARRAEPRAPAPLRPRSSSTRRRCRARSAWTQSSTCSATTRRCSRPAAACSSATASSCSRTTSRSSGSIRSSAERFEVEDLSRATLPEDFARNPRIHVCFLLRPRREMSSRAGS